MKLNSLHTLFVEQLQDLYDAENQIVAALPEMSQAAASADLREAFDHHRVETEEHIRRLEQIFTDLGETASGKRCEAMEGLLSEGSEILDAEGEAAVIDAALIASAQRVEHYEISGYGTVRTYAKNLGYDHAARLLQRTLDEEANADKTLTRIAEGGFLGYGVNEQADRM